MATVWVPGDPATKGSIKCVGRNGMHRLIEDDKAGRLKVWRGRLTAAGRKLVARHPDRYPIDAPVEISATFVLPRPAAARNRPFPNLKGADLDKLARVLLDAWTDAGVWVDDSRVVSLSCAKTYPDDADPGRTGVQVSIYPL